MKYKTAKFDKDHVEKDVLVGSTLCELTVSVKEIGLIKAALEFTIEKDKLLSIIEPMVDVVRTVRTVQKDVNTEFAKLVNKAKAAKAKKEKEAAEKAAKEKEDKKK